MSLALRGEQEALLGRLSSQFPWLQITFVTWLEESDDSSTRYRLRYVLLTKPADATPEKPAIAFSGWSFEEAYQRAVHGVPSIQRQDYNRSMG
jgi:hypothetical protein